VCGCVSGPDRALVDPGARVVDSDALRRTFVRLAAGEFECAACAARDPVRAFRVAEAYLDSLGWDLRGDIEVKVVDAREMVPCGALGYCATRGRPKQSLDVTISLLHQQSEASLTCVAAHELLHAWANFHGLRSLVGEAMCELAAYATAVHIGSRTELRKKDQAFHEQGGVQAVSKALAELAKTTEGWRPLVLVLGACARHIN
jgi:hypothetical protein